MKSKIQLLRSSYDEPSFLNTFSIDNIQTFMSQGRESMITTKNVPTLNMSRLAFGETCVRALITQHLYTLAKAFGVIASDEQMDIVSDDILSGYGDLKITELMLAFKMIREGKFRDGDGNRAKMYGTLDSSVICDCLYQFRFNYRNDILNRVEREERQKAREEAEQNAMKTGTFKEAIYIKVLSGTAEDMKFNFNFFKQYLTQEEMQDLMYYYKEREALLLLKKRVEEFLADNHVADAKVDALAKGVAYINKNFPNGDKQGNGVSDDKA